MGGRSPRVLAAFAAAIVSLGACRPEPRADLSVADAAVAEQAYASLCAACHGDRGAGDGELAAALVAHGFDPPPALDDSERVAQLGRSGIIRAMRNGRAHEGPPSLMPDWERDLGRDLEELVADYVTTFSRGPEIEQGRAADLDPAQGDTLQAGPRLFRSYCASCHGATGRGGVSRFVTAEGPVSAPDLTDGTLLGRRSDRELYEAIAQGGRHAGPRAIMPGWSYELEPPMIRTLVVHVRWLSGAP